MSNNNTASTVLGSTATGAATGASVGGPYGAVIGGIAGLGLGTLTAYENAESEKEKQKILEQAASDLNTSTARIKSAIEKYYAENPGIGTANDVTTYKGLVSSYDPNEFVYDYDDFDNNYDVNDYYATNKDAIIQKTSDQLQHTAAGAGVGRGTGAANQIATGVADKNESLYKDALEAMNSDRTFAYNLWNSNIQDAQNRLNQLKSAKDTQLSLYGNLATDYTDTQASKYQDLLAAQQQAANNKLQLTLASI